MRIEMIACDRTGSLVINDVGSFTSSTRPLLKCLKVVITAQLHTRLIVGVSDCLDMALKKTSFIPATFQHHHSEPLNLASMVPSNSPPSYVQNFTTSNPTEASNSCHCVRVRSMPAATAIILRSKLAAIDGQFISGSAKSLIKTHEWSGIMTAAMLRRIFWHEELGQSCKTVLR